MVPRKPLLAGKARDWHLLQSSGFKMAFSQDIPLQAAVPQKCHSQLLSWLLWNKSLFSTAIFKLSLICSSCAFFKVSLLAVAPLQNITHSCTEFLLLCQLIYMAPLINLDPPQMGRATPPWKLPYQSHHPQLGGAPPKETLKELQSNQHW